MKASSYTAHGAEMAGHEARHAMGVQAALLQVSCKRRCVAIGSVCAVVAAGCVCAGVAVGCVYASAAVGSNCASAAVGSVSAGQRGGKKDCTGNKKSLILVCWCTLFRAEQDVELCESFYNSDSCCSLWSCSYSAVWCSAESYCVGPYIGVNRVGQNRIYTPYMNYRIFGHFPAKNTTYYTPDNFGQLSVVTKNDACC